MARAGGEDRWGGQAVRTGGQDVGVKDRWRGHKSGNKDQLTMTDLVGIKIVMTGGKDRLRGHVVNIQYYTRGFLSFVH